jgi:hypothetical protein
VETTLPEEGERAYMWALIYAVVEHNATFETSDTFADWFATRGRHTYGADVEAAWEHWRAGLDTD